MQFFERTIIGVRPGHGDAGRMLSLASAAAVRNRRNWLLPGLLSIILVGVVIVHGLSFGISASGFSYMFVRIVAIDYLVFMFGWICGWSSAWRWRNNQEFVEELVVTNLRPSVVGALLFAGSLGVWAILLSGMFAADVLMAMLSPDRYTSAATYDSLAVGTFIVLIPFYITLAFFHLETLRIAYWMFSSAALPRLNLMRKAVGNFFIIPMIVFMLTAIGSAITGLCWFAVNILLEVLDIHSASSFDTHLAWGLASIPGLLVVSLIKRITAQQFERDFWKSYLLYTWYGAGEIKHPQSYPLHMHQRAVEWLTFLKQEERRVAKQ